MDRRELERRELERRDKFGLNVGKLTGAAGAALGSQTAATLDFAWLFVKLPTAHLFFNTASLNQFSESAHRFLNRFPVTDHQLDHAVLQMCRLNKQTQCLGLFIKCNVPTRTVNQTDGKLNAWAIQIANRSDCDKPSSPLNRFKAIFLLLKAQFIEPFRFRPGVSLAEGEQISSFLRAIWLTQTL